MNESEGGPLTNDMFDMDLWPSLDHAQDITSFE